MTHSALNFQPHKNEPLSKATTPTPGITLVVAPLGNIADTSDRLYDAFVDADIIAAEDIRRTRNLVTALGISPKGKFISNFDHNEDSRTESLAQAAEAGQKVIVMIGVGMPVVSNPDLVVMVVTHGADVPVSCVPGPSAMTTALTLSGLGVGHLCFDGFTPRKQGARRAWLESLKTEKRACYFFKSPHQLAVTLTNATEILGKERRTSVSRELTKRFEGTRRATLGESAVWAEEGVRGEITVVTEGAGQQATEVSTEDLVGCVGDLAVDGMRLKDATKQIAAEAGMTKHRDLYQVVLAVHEENRQVIATLYRKASQYMAVNRVSTIIDSFCNLRKNEESLRRSVS